VKEDRRERAELLAWALSDFRRFAGLVDIIPKGGQKQKLVLNEIQRKYCATRTARDVVLKPRQVGFTTLEQARDIFHFLTVPGARVATTCQSITGSEPLKQLSKNYRVMFESLVRAGLKIGFRSESQSEWTLADRDATLRIVEAGASEVAAAKKGRAGTISRLHLTETAFYEYADETLNAMLECVPGPEHGSEIVNESTANGAAGFFYRQCKAAGARVGAYKLHFFPWYAATEYSLPLKPGDRIVPENERERLFVERGVTPEQIKWYRSKRADKSQNDTDQEYPSDPETCFLVTGRGFFDQAVTTELLQLADEPIELRERERIAIYRQPIPGHKYILAVDTAEGGGGDPSAGILRDRETAEHCATINGQYTSWDLAESAAKLGHEYNEAEIAVERNNHGHAVLQALQREQKYPRVYKHTDDKFGWPTNAVTRPTMLDALEDAHRKGLWKTTDRNVLAQFRTFIVTATGRAEAARGEHDDLVLAEAIGWAVRQKPQAVTNAYSAARAHRAGMPRARS
jgi:hypothetical protein